MEDLGVGVLSIIFSVWFTAMSIAVGIFCFAIAGEAFRAHIDYKAQYGKEWELGSIGVICLVAILSFGMANWVIWKWAL